MLKHTSVHNPAMTSFFLPVFLTQSRTRLSSHEFSPVRSIGCCSGCTACSSWNSACRSANAVVNSVGTLNTLAALARNTELLTTTSFGCDRKAQQLQILVVDHQKCMVVRGQQAVVNLFAHVYLHRLEKKPVASGSGEVKADIA